MIQETEIFFNADDFASSAAFTPKGGTAQNIMCIFDAPGTLQNIGGVDVITTDPTATVKTADVGTAGQGSTLLVSGVTYYVVQNMPGVGGLSILQLSKDAT
jgi:hypothetical protein